MKVEIEKLFFSGILLHSLWKSVVATYSIVAVDLGTGQVGGAGATCREGDQAHPNSVIETFWVVAK